MTTATLMISFFVGTVVFGGLVFLVIVIVDRGNGSNKLANAIAIASFMTVGQLFCMYWIPLFMGLPIYMAIFYAVWVYRLANYYSMFLLKAFLAAFLIVFIQYLVGVFLFSTFLNEKVDTSQLSNTVKGFSTQVNIMVNRAAGAGQRPRGGRKRGKVSVQEKIARLWGKVSASVIKPTGELVRLVLINGRSIDAQILEEDAEIYRLSIDGGRLETVIRKDEVSYIDKIR